MTTDSLVVTPLVAGQFFYRLGCQRLATNAPLAAISGVEDGVTRRQSNESGAKMKLATPA
ncbi:MAG TPA: hypothetical protein VKC16_00640 [Xanthobacteraceae bacterium]|nr:hypothetical protein [Xanthobacteraceae bacterium]